MKKKFFVTFALVASLLWLAGRALEENAQKAKSEMDSNIAKWKERADALNLAPEKIREIDKKIVNGRENVLGEIDQNTGRYPEMASQLKFRRAEVSYSACDLHLANFIFFYRNAQQEQSGEERDRAARSCKEAGDLMLVQSQSKIESERFYAFYSLGNINVRRAILALSSEEQTLALKQAVESYIEALLIRDDYETKFNLELLISINEQARKAVSEKLSPDDFNLNPTPHGGTPGSGGKSKL